MVDKFDFDVDKFLDAIVKVEKKVKGGNKKKLNNVVNKYAEKKCTEIGKNFTDCEFTNIIDNKIYEGGMTIEKSEGGQASATPTVENILKPLFPNEKVFKNEFTPDKIFLLDKFIGKKKSPKKKENNNFNISNPNVNMANESSNLGVKKIKYKKMKESEIISQLKNDKTLNYNSLLSMNELWNQYITTLFGNFGKSPNHDTIYNKFIKADLHGSIVTVIDAKNKNLIGKKGILLLETRRTINIISQEENVVKTILKKGAVFRIDLPNGNLSVDIIGDNFVYKAVERTKIKFKNKYIL
jgi:RNase P/RNase MRP subunit p29